MQIPEFWLVQIPEFWLVQIPEFWLVHVYINFNRASFLAIPGFALFGSISCFLGLMAFAYNVQQGCDPLNKKIIVRPEQVRAKPNHVTHISVFLPEGGGGFLHFFNLRFLI